IVVAVAAVARGPQIGAGDRREVAARIIAGCGRIAAVSAHRHTVGVHRAAVKLERERDRAGWIEGAGESRRVVQLLAATNDDCRTGDRADRRAGRGDRLVLILAVVGGTVVVEVAAVGGRP